MLRFEAYSIDDFSDNESVPVNIPNNEYISEDYGDSSSGSYSDDDLG